MGTWSDQKAKWSHYVKLQDGHMVCRHSDHILAHPETEIISVANDDWMDLTDKITPLHKLVSLSITS